MVLEKEQVEEKRVGWGFGKFQYCGKAKAHGDGIVSGGLCIAGSYNDVPE